MTQPEPPPARQPDRRGGVSRRLLLGGVGGLVVVGGAAGAAALGLPGTGSGTGGGSDAVEGGGPRAAPFTAHFGTSGLVTNEYAYRRPDAAGVSLSPDWWVTSGSLFAKDGDGWTGPPDSGETGADSRRSTDSAVFRLVTRRRDFGDTEVHCSVLAGRPVTTARTPLQDYDGGHVWLRYHSAQELYALSFCRRDRTVVIKRKTPATDAAAANGGDYATLAEAGHRYGYGSWHTVSARAQNLVSGAVRLRLDIDGRTVLSVDDRTPGPLRAPGGVGLRGDNSELTFRNFSAVPI